MFTRAHLRVLASKNVLPITAIVLIAAVIRLFDFPHGYGFDPDATRDAIIAFEGASHPYFPLAGAFSSTGPFTFGPWYYLSLIMVEFLFKTPFAPWLLMTAATLITVVAMYDIGRLVESRALGYVLAGFAALAPSEFVASGSLSNLSPVTLFAALTLWSSTRILTTMRPGVWWYFVLGASLGLGINAHYQMAGLLIVPVLVWFFSSSRKVQTALAVMLGVFLTFIPLLIFNISHDWHTLRGVVEMYASRDRIYVPNSWKIYLGTFWPSLIQFIFGTPILVSAALLLIVPAVLCFEAFRKLLPRTVWILAIVVFLNIIQLRYYWGERYFPYHYYLEPFLLFLVGYVVYRLASIMRYGVVFSLLIGLSIGFSMVVFDYNRDRSFILAPDQTLHVVAALQANYPDNPIEVYKCDGDRGWIAEATTYVMQFEKKPKSGRPVKLGMIDAICSYPLDQHGRKVVGTPFVDLSLASENALKQASWSAVTTEGVFKKSAKWY
ncbi:MAG: ArnT family glycosyltransferase [Candidatus Levyibacteriota bacterium]